MQPRGYARESSDVKITNIFYRTIPSNNYDRPKTTGECEMF